eukprot:2772595-Heterocapsa_arctica.AAC.1
MSGIHPTSQVHRALGPPRGSQARLALYPSSGARLSGAGPSRPAESRSSQAPPDSASGRPLP